MRKDEIRIEGKGSEIKVESGKNIEVEGDKNVVDIEGGKKDIEIHRDKNIIEIEEKSKKDFIEIGVKDIKKGFKKSLAFFTQKKILNILIIILFLFLLIGSSWIRLQNLPNLKDATTGEYIPLALDPYYFLRVAELKLAGPLPEIDVMRYPSLDTSFTNEILPDVLVFIYKTANIFGDYSLQYLDVISPVIFFVLGLIVFFFFIFILTNSKITALLSSVFLAFIPTYLYRTLTGFADHEAIGMFAFFMAMAACAISLKVINKDEEKKNLIKVGLFGLLAAFLTAFSIVAWGGGSIFIFTVFPLSFFLLWIVKLQHSKDKNFMNRALLFYIVWMVFTIIFGIFFGSNFWTIVNRFMLGTNGIISVFVLLFTLVDYTLILKAKDIKFIKEKFLKAYSFAFSIVLGVIGLQFLGKNIFSLLASVWNGLMHPFGLGRTGLTIAENAQPYLRNWISQVGQIMFWMFFAGVILIGFKLSKGIQKRKNKIWFNILWIAMSSGILFTRISANHVLNGVNFTSQLLYFLGLLLFAGYFIWLYFHDKITVKPEAVFLASWAFFVLISGRSAIRIFFAITPFMCFSASFLVVNIFNYAKKNKDDLLRLIFWILVILLVIGLVISFNNFVKTTTFQAKYTGPSANIQWQKAMGWVRDNTLEMSIFVHWWDYGYWIQYLGKRPTVTDGGHNIGFWDHLIGRYVLTTPYPETALSFMKTHNVSYLLIDLTDLVKYTAYSRIGGDGDNDRFSMIPVILSDPKQTQETANETILVYPAGYGVDKDIFYKFEGKDIFLPGPTYNEIWEPSYKSFLGAVIIKMSSGQTQLKQPHAVFFYQDQQIRLPLRYIYYNGQIYDFKTGLDAVIYILPKISQSNQGIQLENFGAVIYLSPKVSKGLFAQLYLMDDIFNNYPTIKLKHAEPDPSIDSLNKQGLDINEFVYYQGFRGPIKIWRVDYPDNIIVREEFLRTRGEYAEFDNLDFIG